MSTTLDQARAAKKQLAEQFRNAALPVNGLGIGKDDDGYCLRVLLTRAPSAAENAKMPAKVDGVNVAYTVTGKSRAL